MSADLILALLSVLTLVIVSILFHIEKKKVIDFFDHDKNGKAH
ncbi:MAG: hypothetical protein OQK32_04005 [Gammaproteobacteria bacterium]|nr:hypothetical protein [Gammaproteobacteria bacterium]MCW8923685.1 hypothetical protein [Gammaproteobacteria bacterium]